MRISGLQKLTLLDYPEKLACILFTPGCNFRCPFCHNPSLVRQEDVPLSLDEVLDFLQRRKGKLTGVVFTGGEPLLQSDIASFMRTVRQMGYKIKLDTNGSLPDRLEELLEQNLLDYIAMDIKADREGYAALTGLAVPPLEKVEKSIRLLQESGKPYEFRTTMVKPLHTADSFLRIADWLCGADTYVLQAFARKSELLHDDPLFAAFSAQEAAAIRDSIVPHFTRCFLRGYEET